MAGRRAKETVSGYSLEQGRSHEPVSTACVHQESRDRFARALSGAAGNRTYAPGHTDLVIVPRAILKRLKASQDRPTDRTQAFFREEVMQLLAETFDAHPDMTANELAILGVFLSHSRRQVITKDYLLQVIGIKKHKSHILDNAIFSLMGHLDVYQVWSLRTRDSGYVLEDILETRSPVRRT